jgi:Isocitrate lyase
VKLSRRFIQRLCWHITVHHLSIGRRILIDATIAKFQKELGAMGYKFSVHHFSWYSLNVAWHVLT